jgi:hypothetical protein
LSACCCTSQLAELRALKCCMLVPIKF